LEGGIIGLVGLRVKAIIFDLDGTLVDSRQAFIMQNYELLRKFAPESATIEDAVSLLGQSPTQILQKLSGEQKDYSEEVRMIDESYVKYYMKKFVSLFPGAMDCLKQLKKRKIKLGLATNTSSVILNDCMEWTGLSKVIDDAVSAEQVPREKPAPDILLETIKRLRVRPEQTIYVGDTHLDVVAAKEAGMISFVTLRNAIDNPSAVLKERPDLMIPSVGWVCRILQ